MTGIEQQSVLDETLKKIGRNVLNFQRMEAMLKFLISRSSLEGTANELQPDHEKAVEAVSMQTMGNLVKSFVASAYSEPNVGPPPEPQNEQAWFSLSFKIEADRDSIEKRRAALAALVEERNVLVHQMLIRFDLTSVESCRELTDLLDAQAERMRPEFEALRSLSITVIEGRKEAVAAMAENLRDGASIRHA